MCTWIESVSSLSYQEYKKDNRHMFEINKKNLLKSGLIDVLEAMRTNEGGGDKVDPSGLSYPD